MVSTLINPQFETGRLVVTAGVQEWLISGDAAHKVTQVANTLQRYVEKDWGDLDQGDKALNDAAFDLENPTRILAAYVMDDETRIWIITEWDRSVTTILLPEEY